MDRKAEIILDSAIDLTKKKLINANNELESSAFAEVLKAYEECKNALENQSKWIRVEDQLPEYDEGVLCSCRGLKVKLLFRRKETKFNCEQWETQDGRPYALGIVTHWMKLPEQPKCE